MSHLVYMAGPLFSQADREFLEKMVDCLAQASHLDPYKDFFLPHRDGAELGKGATRHFIFNLDINKVNAADVVIALLDGQDSDSGTCIELGYAYALKKKIFGILTDFRSYYTNGLEPHRPNLMIWGVCENGNTIYDNLKSLSSAFSEYIHGTSKTTDKDVTVPSTQR